MSLLHTHKRRRLTAPTTGGTTLVVLFYHMRARQWQCLKNTLWTLDSHISLQTPTGRKGMLTQGGVRLFHCPTEAQVPRILKVLQSESQALVIGAYAGETPLDVYDLEHRGQLCSKPGMTGDPLGQTFSACLQEMQGGARSLTHLVQQPQMTLVGLLQRYVSSKK